MACQVSIEMYERASAGIPNDLSYVSRSGSTAVKNCHAWRPSKYVYRNGVLIASRDRNEVGVGSRLMADLIARFYDKALRQHARGKLLDLGCGRVPLFEAYRSHISTNICVDWANTLHRNDYVDCECDLTEDLPFPDNEFDTIILADVLEHVPRPERLWREMARVLSGNGKVIMNVPFYYWLHEQPHDYYRYTEFALRRFVAEAGLRLIELDAIGGAPEILADVLSKNLLRLPRVGSVMAGCMQGLAAILIRTRLGKRVSQATRANFPFGYSLVAVKPL